MHRAYGTQTILIEHFGGLKSAAKRQIEATPLCIKQPDVRSVIVGRAVGSNDLVATDFNPLLSRLTAEGVP